jgi:hypothetical protein
MSQPLEVIIVERIGTLKMLSIKDFKQEELYKKCGFKKAEDFNKQTEWSVKLNGTKYIIHLYAKTEGRANSENKYDFPPPVDTTLFYGSCALVGYIKTTDGAKILTNVSVALWNKIYEKLFGGFEDLAATAKEDEEEEDELENIPKEKKTKQGYLKDGFVVDSSDTEENSQSPSASQSDTDDVLDKEDDNTEDDEDDIMEDVGSELSEESYDYDDDNVGK